MTHITCYFTDKATQFFVLKFNRDILRQSSIICRLKSTRMVEIPLIHGTVNVKQVQERWAAVHMLNQYYGTWDSIDTMSQRQDHAKTMIIS